MANAAQLVHYFPFITGATLAEYQTNIAALPDGLHLERLSRDQVYNLSFILQEADMPVENKVYYIESVATGAATVLQDNPLMIIERTAYERRFNIDTTEIEVQVSTFLVCPRCRARKVTFKAAFVRAADEAQAILCYCTVCRLRFQL